MRTVNVTANRYVRHIDKGVATLQSRTGSKLDGPLTLTAGPAAGQSINYFRTPFYVRRRDLSVGEVRA